MNGITLTEEQAKILAEAVHWFKYSSEQVFEIDGKAGTGKTFLIYQILNALCINANEYLPMAPTGQAAIVMRTRGFITARSIHSTLYEVIETKDIEEKTAKKFGIPGSRKIFRLRKYIDPKIRLFFIDEAYMVPANMVKDILSFGVKVIVCGDAHQLPPIGGNPAFLTGYGIHHLTQLMRQAEQSAIVYIAERASNGLPIHCGQYGNEVLVINEDDFIPEMIGFSDCICCGTNRTRDYLNSYIRDIAGFKGPLPWLGEQVICRKNNWDIEQDGLALANGLRGTVLTQPTVNKYDGKTFQIAFKPDLVNTVFYDVDVNLLYFTSPLDIKTEMKGGGIDNDKYIYERGEYFEFAYALTTHLCQGSEYRRGIYIEEFLKQQIQNQLNYTGVTRFKQQLIYIKKKKKYF